MQKNKICYVIIFICCCLLSFEGVCQEKNNSKTPIREILLQIEKQFDVRFSYADENLNEVFITPPNFKDKLETILRDIETHSSLFFEKLNDNYYTISKRKEDQICGIVVDVSTNEKIYGASILTSENNEVAVSDKQGEFFIQDIEPSTELRINVLGFQELSINTSELLKKPCATIFLQPKTELLDEVLVQQYLTTGLKKKKDGSIVVKTEEFGILPGLIEPDVLQTIQALPGIESINETVSNINMRGGTHDQNLLLWDGIKMYQSGHFFGLISAFNPYLTEKIAVIKNGTSASFGNGVSSTIDMKSFNSIKDSCYVGAGVNLISGDVFAHIPINKSFGVQVSARRSMTDFLKTPTYNQFYNRVFQDSKITNTQNEELEKNIDREERFFFYDTSVKFLYDLDDIHKFRTSLVYMNNDLEYEEKFTKDNNSETKTSTLKQQNFAFGGNVTSNWSNDFKTNVEAYYTNYNLEAVNFALLSNQKVIVNNEILETGIKLSTQHTLKNSLNFLNGYQFYEVGITNLEDVNKPNFRRKATEVMRNHALFSEVEYQPNNTFIRLGMRLNYVSDFSKFLAEPRINIHHKINNFFNVELLGEMKSQVANQIIDLQRDFLGVEKRKWILANNNDFPIGKSKQVSLGFNYNKKSFYAGLEGFYKQVDGITTSNQSFFNQNQFQRTTGSYDIKGLEFLVNKKTPKYSSWLSYTLSKNEYTFQSINPQNFLNNLDIRHSLSFAGTYTVNKLKVALGVNWRTGKPYTKPVQGNEVTITDPENIINYQTPNSSNLPSYFRVDVSTRYNIDFDTATKATIGFSVLNLLNRKNTLDVYYRLPEAKSTEVQQVESVSLGITPNISFRVFF